MEEEDLWNLYNQGQAVFSRIECLLYVYIISNEYAKVFMVPRMCMIKLHVGLRSYMYGKCKQDNIITKMFSIFVQSN